VSDRLYTDNIYLLVLVVFLATLVNGLIHLLLLLLFSSAAGIYTTLLPALIPQSLLNAFVASLLFRLPLSTAGKEAR
jgi:rod shape-determining protein MreD